MSEPTGLNSKTEVLVRRLVRSLRTRMGEKDWNEGV